MKRKMILKRITSFVCAMMVLIGAVGGAVPYKADPVDKITKIKNAIDEKGVVSSSKFAFDSSCSYIVIYTYDGATNGSGHNVYVLAILPEYVSYVGDFKLRHVASTSEYYVRIDWFEQFSCYEQRWYSKENQVYEHQYSQYEPKYTPPFSVGFSSNSYEILYSDFDVYYDCSNGGCSGCAEHYGKIAYATEGTEEPDVAEDLGYLLGFSHKILWKRGELYNYNEETEEHRFSFSNITTSGLDLSKGGYSIKHYVRPLLVTGYKEEDIVEKYDKYYDNTYQANLGCIQYLQTELDERLETQGYDGPSWIDKYILGRFVVRWHYFVIVNDSTGEVGGYVCLKPRDNDPNNFGTEFEVVAVDEDDNIDEDYEEDTAYTGSSSYTDEDEKDDAWQDAEDDAQEQEAHTNIVNLNGLEIFSSVMQSFADSTASFSAVIGNFFGCLPPWVLTVFGLSVALTFLAFIIKNLR